VRHHRCDWSLALDKLILEFVINSYSSAPVGYSVGLVVTDNGRTVLVEIYYEYSLGFYRF